MQSETDLVTAPVVAKHFGVAVTTVRIWTRRGLIPSVRISRKTVRYNMQDVIGAVKRRVALAP